MALRKKLIIFASSLVSGSIGLLPLLTQAAFPRDVFIHTRAPATKNLVLSTLENIVSWFGIALGIFSVGLILWAAFLFMSAGGSESRLKTAKAWLKWGIIGIVVALFANVAVFLVNSFLSPEPFVPGPGDLPSPSAPKLP